MHDNQSRIDKNTQWLRKHNHLPHVVQIEVLTILGYNYEVSNGLFEVGRDMFLRLAADSRHDARSGGEMMRMGVRSYK
jgi:hypothetical protein